MTLKKYPDNSASDVVKGQRRRQEFENHSPYVREILAEALEEHRKETLVKSVYSLAAGYDLSIEEVCSALEIDIKEYLDAKKQIADE